MGKNLGDAKDWTEEASDTARRHELEIERLQSELELVRQEHSDAVDTFRIQERAAKENHEAKKKEHDQIIAKLSAELDQQAAELARLNAKTSDVHVEHDNTVKAMREKIDEHAAA